MCTEEKSQVAQVAVYGCVSFGEYYSDQNISAKILWAIINHLYLSCIRDILMLKITLLLPPPPAMTLGRVYLNNPVHLSVSPSVYARLNKMV